MPEIDFKSFPITRYQGSKRKILPWLHENFQDLEFDTALDAFGGSSIVSYLLKRMGKNVTYNDQLKFNHIIGKALIQNQRIKLNDEDVQNLFEWMRLNPQANFIEQTFAGYYYYRRENRWLDQVSNGILNMNHYVGQTLDYKKSIAYYALFQACMIKRPFNLFHRKNLNIRRRNDVVRNFGNKVTWSVAFEEYFLRFIREANSVVFNSRTNCLSTNESVFEIQNVNYDLVYLDPPYLSKKGTNESSNYVKCYHFLEGLANYERWEELIDFDSINLRFKKELERNDFSEDNIFETYDRLFDKFQNSTIVLSYKEGGIPSVDTLKRLMKVYKRNVYTRSMDYRYALNRKNEDVREVLIIGI